MTLPRSLVKENQASSPERSDETLPVRAAVHALVLDTVTELKSEASVGVFVLASAYLSNSTVRRGENGKNIDELHGGREGWDDKR